MITRVMVALLALYLVSGGGENRAGWAPAAPPAAVSERGPAPPQASVVKQTLDYCLANRSVCAELAGGLLATTGALPSAIPAPAPAPSGTDRPETGIVSAPAQRPAPELPVPPRRHPGSTGA